MSRTFTIDRSALLKIILHSLKYPTTAINGILLGKEKIHSNTDAVQDGGNAGALNGKSKVLHIYDAVPVTHNYIALSGPFEAALAQVDKYCADDKEQDLGIVGYYQSNERLEDTDLGGIGQRYADRLEALKPGSVALVLCAKELQTLIEGGKELAAPIKLFYKESGKNWKAASSSGGDAEFSCPVGGLGDLIESLVMQGQHRNLIDFEDHLNNIDEDWLNQHLHV